MNNKEIKKDEGSWIGKKGFDEAQYYNDEKFDIGFSHSDEHIKQKILETIERLDESSTDLEVKVEEGIVTLKGRIHHPEKVEELSRIIAGFSGVKKVQNDLQN